MSRQRPDAVLRDNKSCWISIDGVDGVGKTVLAQHLAMVLDEVTRVLEFSEGLEDGVSLISASVRHGSLSSASSGFACACGGVART